MNSDNSIKSVVKDLIQEYIKPKYPIYRVKYIHSYVVDSSEEDYSDNPQPPYKIRSRVMCRLMECKMCTILDTCPHGFKNMCIHNRSHCIFPHTITEFFQNGYVADHNDEVDHVTIIDIKRVA
tara:strand:- start:11299 stop:11667 length:369 start_codon:yes stop_codon:yes gene_type:complete